MVLYIINDSVNIHRRSVSVKALFWSCILASPLYCVNYIFYFKNTPLQPRAASQHCLCIQVSHHRTSCLYLFTEFLLHFSSVIEDPMQLTVRKKDTENEKPYLHISSYTQQFISRIWRLRLLMPEVVCQMPPSSLPGDLLLPLPGLENGEGKWGKKVWKKVMGYTRLASHFHYFSPLFSNVDMGEAMLLWPPQSTSWNTIQAWKHSSQAYNCAAMCDDRDGRQDCTIVLKTANGRNCILKKSPTLTKNCCKWKTNPIGNEAELYLFCCGRFHLQGVVFFVCLF